MNSELTSLACHTWNTSYRHEDGDLISLFYVPALSCALRYDRTTGFFNADALALAARGIARLIENGGEMRLIVGCTLDEDEVRAIQEGYDLREKIAEKLAAVPLNPPDIAARNGLEALAWMVAHGRLDVKVAVPVAADGTPVVSHGIYHEKVGIITDRDGNQISFSGSINETKGGWIDNRESFHVHCSWAGEREAQHVQDEVRAFSRLWVDQMSTVRVFTFPEAAKQKLLEFLPKDDRPVRKPTHGSGEPLTDEEPSLYSFTPDEKRRAVWTYIHNAARMWNGMQVGVVTSCVKPWPHQMRTFTRMHNGWPFRLLIADEVGLGKTITAGMLIRQVWLSGMARRILVLVPAGILHQWQNELYEKFNLNVPIYDGQRLLWKQTHGWQGSPEKKVGRHEWHEERFVLCSSHLMRRRDRVQDLLEADDWDLIVLDEAHHARRKAPGSPQEGGPNALLRLMRELRSRCQALLLLTATPMQIHPIEVWDLLNLLGLPPRWSASESDFLRYFETARGNPSHDDMRFLCEMFQDTELCFGPVDEKELEKAVPELGLLGRQKVLKALRDKSGIPLKRLETNTRQGALRVLRRFSPIRFLMARHTRELLRSYYKRGLLETPIATRDPRDIAVSLSPTERALYNRVEDYISTTYNRAAPEKRTAIGFVMTIYRRRLASSFHALRCTLTNRLARKSEPIDEEDISQDEIQEEIMDAECAFALACQSREDEEDAEIKSILKQIAQLGTDSKARELKSQLEGIFAEGYDSALVFTHYTDTMDYLKDYLAEHFRDKSIACYSGRGGERRDGGGSWTICSKESVRQALKRKEIRLLVCTDAAGEGLNLQYCGALINYDLPWNPMKIEQRIGRIDRIGQQYPTIRIINLAYKNTVEADIYFALASRINLFQGIVGRLQPILSRLPKEFERLTLQPPARRDAGQARCTADIEQMVEESERVAFDIDDVVEEAAEMPDLPEPALTLEQIDTSLNRPDIRPPEIDWKKLDYRSYSLQLPGMSESIRATTSGDVFEDHFESHEFLSPGGHLFADLEKGQVSQEVQSDSAKGHFWIIESSGGRSCEFIAMTRNGPRRIETLNDLVASLENLGPPDRPDPSQWKDPTIRLVI